MIEAFFKDRFLGKPFFEKKSNISTKLLKKEFPLCTFPQKEIGRVKGKQAGELHMADIMAAKKYFDVMHHPPDVLGKQMRGTAFHFGGFSHQFRNHMPIMDMGVGMRIHDEICMQRIECGEAADIKEAKERLKPIKPEITAPAPPETVDFEFYEGPISSNTFSRINIKVPRRNGLNAGVECIFIPFNDKCGIKMYACFKDGKNAMECQQLAHHARVAPEVHGELMEFVFPLGSKDKLVKQFFGRENKGKAYGYYTQRANLSRVTHHEYNEDFHKEPDYILMDNKIKMANLPFSISDTHSHNVGYIGDDMVVIDFGWHTTFKD